MRHPADPLCVWTVSERMWRMFWRVYGWIHSRLRRPARPLKRLTRGLVGPPYHETVQGLVMPAMKARADAAGDGSRPFLIVPNRYRPGRFWFGTAIFEWDLDTGRTVSEAP